MYPATNLLNSKFQTRHDSYACKLVKKPFLRSKVVEPTSYEVASTLVTMFPPPSSGGNERRQGCTVELEGIVGNVGHRKRCVTASGAGISKSTHASSMGRVPLKDRGQSNGIRLEDARSNRKILDLEISIQSLLTLNENLEAKVRKQAAEITKLRNCIQHNLIDRYSLDVCIKEVA
ncbi:uncharacterized protein VTP21DRAFT_3343 [Calcarisporiella thermophila]|uniref:uncharacterized protein n=1 Tax=Calcarisporiella thermophila TaxID=911321 RepID=UPI003743FC60